MPLKSSPTTSELTNRESTRVVLELDRVCECASRRLQTVSCLDPLLFLRIDHRFPYSSSARETFPLK